MIIKKNFFLKKFTAMRVGGPAKYFVIVKSERELVAAIESARQYILPWHVVGAGSNLIPADRGYEGVIINFQFSKISIQKQTVRVGAGHNLQKLIGKLNRRGLEGMERMAGIPGTVGGAIYGCAGAYGQEIKDHLVSVSIFDGSKFRRLTRAQCKFAYRSSIFKKRKNWVIVDAIFRLREASPRSLLKISRETVKLREKKYWPGLNSPGSFYKNLLASEIRVPGELKNSIVYGKLPSGVLLERVRARGMREGGVQVARHHANLIYNMGGGTARDVKKLSTRLKALVKKSFGIIIDEEVQYL